MGLAWKNPRCPNCSSKGYMRPMKITPMTRLFVCRNCNFILDEKEGADLLKVQNFTINKRYVKKYMRSVMDGRGGNHPLHLEN